MYISLIDLRGIFRVSFHSFENPNDSLVRKIVLGVRAGETREGKGMAKRKSTLFPLPFSPSFFDSSIPRFPELALRSRAPTNASSSEPCKAVRGREDRRKKGGGQRHPCNHQRLTHSFHPCFPPCFSSSLRALILLPAHTRCRERERHMGVYRGGDERGYPKIIHGGTTVAARSR